MISELSLQYLMQPINMIHHQEQMADSEEYETIPPLINPKRNTSESTGIIVLSDFQILETINNGKCMPWLYSLSISIHVRFQLFLFCFAL